MQASIPTEKIAIWPKFNQPSDVHVFVAETSYFAMDTSKRLASIVSLPKYFTVS